MILMIKIGTKIRDKVTISDYLKSYKSLVEHFLVRNDILQK